MYNWLRKLPERETPPLSEARRAAEHASLAHRASLGAHRPNNLRRKSAAPFCVPHNHKAVSPGGALFIQLAA